VKFCLYGNPTIDVVNTGVESRVSHGGGVYYSSMPLLKRNFNIEVYSAISPRLLKHPVIAHTVKLQYSSRTNIFVLTYSGNTRSISVVERAPPLYHWNSHKDLCYTIVNPVIGEVDVSLLKLLRVKSQLLAVDMQGFLREVGENREVVLRPSIKALEVLELTDIVHVDIEEAWCLVSKYAAGNSFNEALSMLTRRSRAILVVTRGLDKITIARSGSVIDIEADKSYKAIDKTGAGDYFLAEYLVQYLSSGDIIESACKAHEEVTQWLKSRDLLLHRAPYYSMGEFRSLGMS
jgi:hypothetical protein